MQTTGFTENGFGRARFPAKALGILRHGAGRLNIGLEASCLRWSCSTYNCVWELIYLHLELFYLLLEHFCLQWESVSDKHPKGL